MQLRQFQKSTAFVSAESTCHIQPCGPLSKLPHGFKALDQAKLGMAMRHIVEFH
jgi:hypothetical protein